jgi:membrane-associated phospholipid phosphatase
VRDTAWHRAGRELAALDRAVYAAIAGTATPTVEPALALISRSADRSVLWLGIATGMGMAGKRSRRAGLVGVTAIGLTSALVNVAIKPVVGRRRPSRIGSVRTHVVRMPGSTSYPSGHAASAFAFSSALSGSSPQLTTAVRILSATVAYSRVHAGVHYPFDVLTGAIIGWGVGTAVRHIADASGYLCPGSARPPADCPTSAADFRTWTGYWPSRRPHPPRVTRSPRDPGRLEPPG